VKLVVDANILISALISDATTRTLLVTLDNQLLAPAQLREEVEGHADLIQDKSGLSAEEVTRSIDRLFDYIEVVPRSDIEPCLDRANRTLGDTDEDDVVFLATALAEDAAIWSDDTDFQEQDLVPVYTTSGIVDEIAD